MPNISRQPGMLSFDTYEVHLPTQEVLKHGLRIKLPPQAFRVLQMLLERPGQLVTREELRQALWPADTFVDFDQGLNNAVKKIRDLLNDSAGTPRYIETLPRLGYRFVGEVNGRTNWSVTEPTDRNDHSQEASRNRGPAAQQRLRLLIVSSAVVILGLAGSGIYLVGHRAPATDLGIHSIAVLPLEDLTAEPEQDYFASGITEMLITDLGRVSALRVISSTSVRQYKGMRKPLSEIWRELNVDAVVEGALFRSGDRVRVTVHLVRLPVEKQLWSQAYEGDLRDLSALQVDIAGDILNQLRVQVAPQEESFLARRRRPASDPEAYRLYMQGRYLASKGGVPNCKKSLAYFEQAIQADPSYALAYAGLADSYGLLSNAGALDPDEGNGKMKSLALKALELDDQLGEAHESLGYYYMVYEWNWAMAEAEFRRAIMLSPNFADAHEGYALYLQYMGRTKESLVEIRKAYDLDPLSSEFAHALAWNYLYQRDYDHAIEQFHRNLDLEPNLAGDRRGLGYAYLQKGRFDDAIAEIKRAQALQEDGNPNALAILAYAYGIAGNHAEAQHVRKLLQRSPRQPGTAYQLLLHIGAGETDRAFALLEKAAARHELLWSFVAADPRNDPLRYDPRFADLFRRLKLPY